MKDKILNLLSTVSPETGMTVNALAMKTCTKSAEIQGICNRLVQDGVLETYTQKAFGRNDVYFKKSKTALVLESLDKPDDDTVKDLSQHRAVRDIGGTRDVGGSAGNAVSSGRVLPASPPCNPNVEKWVDLTGIHEELADLKTINAKLRSDVIRLNQENVQRGRDLADAIDERTRLEERWAKRMSLITGIMEL